MEKENDRDGGDKNMNTHLSQKSMFFIIASALTHVVRGEPHEHKRVWFSSAAC